MLRPIGTEFELVHTISAQSTRAGLRQTFLYRVTGYMDVVSYEGALPHMVEEVEVVGMVREEVPSGVKFMDGKIEFVYD